MTFFLGEGKAAISNVLDQDLLLEALGSARLFASATGIDAHASKLHSPIADRAVNTEYHNLTARNRIVSSLFSKIGSWPALKVEGFLNQCMAFFNSSDSALSRCLTPQGMLLLLNPTELFSGEIIYKAAVSVVLEVDPVLRVSLFLLISLVALCLVVGTC